MQTRRTRSLVAAIAALTSLVVGRVPAFALPDEETEAGIERVTESTLISITLPDGALRSTSGPDLKKIEEALQQIARTNHGKMGKIEVLIWTDKAAMESLPERLKGAGYGYTARDSAETEAGRITPMTAVWKDRKKDPKADLLGMWIEKDGIVLLAWGLYTPDNIAQPGKPRKSDRPADEEKPEKAVPPSSGKGRVPADLLGAWSWTTISSVNYQDTITGQLKEPSGMSAKFTFSPDGKYTKFFYVRQRTYSLVTESTTTEEGTVQFISDGTFTVRPAKGHYKGHTGSRIIDRDMTAEERKPAVWYWEWRTTDGKRQLYIGPSKEALSLFKKAD